MGRLDDQENEPVDLTSERLCHAPAAITMDTYSHAIPGLREDAAQRIDATLRRAIARNRFCPVAVEINAGNRS
jgi:hypothetical protein